MLGACTRGDELGRKVCEKRVVCERSLVSGVKGCLGCVADNNVVEPYARASLEAYWRQDAFCCQTHKYS